jgi:hypothetical protein
MVTPEKNGQWAPLESLNLKTGCREIKFQAAIFSVT